LAGSLCLCSCLLLHWEATIIKGRKSRKCTGSGQLQLGNLCFFVALRTNRLSSRSAAKDGSAFYDGTAPPNREENHINATPFVSARLQPCQKKRLS
jgi:hypothetical protein